MTDQEQTKGKRKKASRACGHCQKAHLTCDDMRPCSRCVKRDLAATCADGVRKKAKYLLDVDEDAIAQAATSSTPQTTTLSQEMQVNSQSQDPTPPPTLDPIISTPEPTPTPSLLSFPLAPNFDFSSKTVNLEYSFLSNMLGAPPASDPTSSFQMSDFAFEPQQHESLGTTNSPVNAMTEFGAEKEEVYKTVLQPYDYREGFHYLVRYVKERMEKPSIMRICRALAQFRPSFMALIMNLTPSDLIFMEKCFQRTITEFDKLIGFSGTPTVVWRRTGEIALVGKEFSILTQWPREQLLEKKTYIYELMDNESAVDYWEKFSLIAFDNSQQSVMMTCNLRSPSGRPVSCAFCFTIKRDIFDVPLAVVGNFLPLFRPG